MTYDARTAVGLRPLHDGRAWALFFLVAMVMLGSIPFAGNARAQLPGGLPLVPTEDPDPESAPSEDPPEEEEGPLPVPLPVPAPVPPAPPGGGEDPPAGDPPPSGGSGLKTAYFTSPASDLQPGTLNDDTAQCVVVPDTCTEDAQQITGPIREGITAAQDGTDSGSQGAPQPVPENALPVGLLNGNQRYSSAVDIGPPDVPEGKTVGEYLITFQLSSASFSAESPAFREAMTAAISQAGSGGPEAFEAYFESVGNGDTALLTQEITGLEACVIAEPWDAGENQSVTEEPEVNFFYCSDAAYPDDANQVTFNMTFPAQDQLADECFCDIDWSNGLLIRPLAAQNLAYGDRDYSTNYYAYIEPLGEFPPTFAVTQQDKPEPIPTVAPNAPGSSPTGGSVGSTSGRGPSSTSGRGSSGSSFPSGSASGTTARPSSPSATSQIAVPSPGALGGSDVAALDQPTDDGGFSPDTTPVNEPGGSFPMAFLMLPMVLGGAFWYGRVLDGAPVTQVARSGAMTRLLRERGFKL